MRSALDEALASLGGDEPDEGLGLSDLMKPQRKRSSAFDAAMASLDQGEPEEEGLLGKTMRAIEPITRPLMAGAGGVSTMVNLARGAVEGDPLAHFKLSPEGAEGGVLGDIAGATGFAKPRMDQASAADVAMGGIGMLPALAMDQYDVRRDAESYAPGHGPGDDPLMRRSFAQANPWMAGAEAVAAPLAHLGMTMGTDPLMGGMEKLTAAAGKGTSALAALESGFLAPEAATAAQAALKTPLLAQNVNRALGASFIPGMALGAVEGGERFLEAGREHGYLSPEALGAGSEALTSGIMAGFGGYHALAPHALHAPGAPRESLNRDFADLGFEVAPDQGGPVRPPPPGPRGFDLGPDQGGPIQPPPPSPRDFYLHPEQAGPIRPAPQSPRGFELLPEMPPPPPAVPLAPDWLEPHAPLAPDWQEPHAPLAPDWQEPHRELTPEWENPHEPLPDDFMAPPPSHPKDAAELEMLQTSGILEAEQNTAALQKRAQFYDQRGMPLAAAATRAELERRAGGPMLPGLAPEGGLAPVVAERPNPSGAPPMVAEPPVVPETPAEVIPFPDPVEQQWQALQRLGWTPEHLAELDPSLIPQIIANGEGPAWTLSPHRAWSTNFGGKQKDTTHMNLGLAEKQAELLGGQENPFAPPQAELPLQPEAPPPEAETGWPEIVTQEGQGKVKTKPKRTAKGLSLGHLPTDSMPEHLRAEGNKYARQFSVTGEGDYSVADLPEHLKPHAKAIFDMAGLQHQATLNGHAMRERLRSRYGDKGEAGVTVESQGQPGDFDIVHRGEDGHIISGAEVRRNALAMIGGGRGLGEKESAGATYRKLDELGVERNDAVTVMGTETRRGHEARGTIEGHGDAEAAQGQREAGQGPPGRPGDITAESGPSARGEAGYRGEAEPLAADGELAAPGEIELGGREAPEGTGLPGAERPPYRPGDQGGPVEATGRAEPHPAEPPAEVAPPSAERERLKARIHAKAESLGLNPDAPKFKEWSKEVAGSKHLDDMAPDQLQKVLNSLNADPKAFGRRAAEKLTKKDRDEMGSPILPGQEDWAPEKRKAVRDYTEWLARELDKTERAEPTGPRYNKDRGFHGMRGKTQGTPFEGLGASPSKIVKALKRDEGNRLELEALDAVHKSGEWEAPEEAEAYREEPRDAYDEGDEGDASFNPEEFESGPKYAVRRPAPGQRGLPGIGEDVAPREREQEKRGPRQADMFGQGEMLQGTERKGTEAREATGSLFTQERDARERREAGAQRTLGEEPRGVPIERAAQETNEKAENFRRWFGDSKITDEDGKPLRLYHQTAADFNTFRPGGHDPTLSGKAIWLAGPDRRQDIPSAHNAHPKKEGARVLPVFVKMENPLILDDPGMRDWAKAAFANGGADFPELLNDKAIAAMKKEGYDGIQFWQHGNKTAHADEYIVFDPEQVKSATGNKGTYDPKNPDIRYSAKQNERGFFSQLSRAMDETKQVAGKAEDWNRYLRDQKRGVKAEELKWTGLDDFLAARKGQKVTKQEIQEFLEQNEVQVEETVLGRDANKTDKARLETLNDRAARRQRHLEEELRRAYLADGAPADWARRTALTHANEVANGDSIAMDDASVVLGHATDEPGFHPVVAGVSEAWGEHNSLRNEMERQARGHGGRAPKFAQYQEPGGENYRELLLTLPKKRGRKATYSVRSEGRNHSVINNQGETVITAGTREYALLRAAEYNAEGLPEHIADRDGSGNFRSSHFPDENILAHVRFNERTDADGKRVLFLEEIQSDWAQKGRREGFRTPEGELPSGYELLDMNAEARADGYDVPADAPEQWRFTSDSMTSKIYNSRAEAIAAATRDADVGGARPPSGPFVGKTEAWSELAMKRMIRWAAENGFDRIAWTKGAQQAARYDLSKQISEIQYYPDRQRLVAYPLDGKRPVLDETVTPEKLADHIGKDAADKLMATEAVELPPSRAAAPAPAHSLRGLDLRVGGEGMKGFYDKILPGVAGKLGKKFGAQVGETRLTKKEAKYRPELTTDEAISLVTPDEIRELARGQSDDAVAHANKIADVLEQDGPDAAARAITRQALRHEIRDLAAQRRGPGELLETPFATAHSMDITPEMRRSVVEQGQPLFAADKGAQARHPLTIDRVKAALPNFDFETAEDGSHVTKLKDGGELRVSPVGEIIVTNKKALAESALAGGVEGEGKPVGSYQKIGRNGAIQIAKDAPPGTEHHEAFHFFFDRALNEKEKRSVLDKYGDEESAAYAYQDWTPKQVNSWFSKIMSYAKRLVHVFKPTWESTFEEARSGRAGSRIREARGETSARRFSTDSPEGHVKDLTGFHNITAEEMLKADKIGGLPMPSIAITRGKVHEGYGGVTLIGDRELVDPKAQRGNEAYPHDAYTGRFPKTEWKLKRGGKDKFMAQFPRRQEFGELGDNLWDAIDEGPDKAFYEARKSAALKAAFLAEKGIKADPVMSPKSQRFPFLATDPDLQAWREANPHAMNELRRGTPEWTEFSKLVEAAIEKAPDLGNVDSELAQDVRAARRQQLMDEDGIGLSYGHRIMEDLSTVKNKTTELDRRGGEESTEKLLKGHEAEYEEWMRKKIAPLYEGEFLRLGRKRVPVTMDNLIEIMHREGGAGSEKNMTFGPGQARAAAARPFSSVEAMHRAKDKLVSAKTFKEWKAANDKIQEEMRSALLPSFDGGTWDGLDSVYKSMARYLQGGPRTGFVDRTPSNIRRILQSNGFRNVPSSAIEMFKTVGESIMDAPTEYFEAKPKRAVGFHEFAGAAIPEDAPAALREMLDRRGIPYETYKGKDSPEGESDRQRAVDKLLVGATGKGREVRFQAAAKSVGDRVENFKRWFGDAPPKELVNEDGSPRVVYHGTGAKFNRFSKNKATMGGITWFTSDKGSIEKGEAGAQGKGHVMDLYASLKNPAGWKEYDKFGLGELKSRGYDGAILPDKDGSFTGFVFEPTQLKSASKNRGTFDPKNPDIRYATARPGPTQGTLPGMPATPPKKARLVDMLVEGFKGNILSGIGTHGVNIGSVGVDTGYRMYETALSGVVDRMLGGERSRHSGAALDEFKGAVEAAPAGLKAFVDGMKKTFDSQGHIPGKAGKVFRAPFQVLEAGDAGTSVVGRSAELAKMAANEARRQGGSSAQIASKAAQLRAHPPAEWGPILDAKVEERQFKTKATPDGIIEFLNKAAEKNPALEFIFPFRKTPGNVIKTALGRTPIGFKDGIKAYQEFKAAERSGVKGDELNRLKGEAVDKLVRPIAGTIVMGSLYAAAQAGAMVGSGPTDPKQAAIWRKTGKQAYSFRVPNGNGGATYVPFARFQPVSNLLMLAADAAELKDTKKAGELWDKGIAMAKSSILNQPYLTGLADVAQFLNDPKSGSAYVTSLASAAVPNIVNKAAQALDPVYRDTTPSKKGLPGLPEKILNTWKSRIPGLSQTLPARRTATGDVDEREGNALSRFASPVQLTSDKPEADVERLLLQADYTPGAPSRDFNVGRGVKVRLTDSEYQVLQDAQKSAAKIIRTSYARNPRFLKLDPEEQKKALAKVYDQERAKARERLAKNRSFRHRAVSATREASI